MLIYKQLYAMLDHITGGLCRFMCSQRMARLVSPGHPDLVVERIAPKTLSVAHYKDEGAYLVPHPYLIIRFEPKAAVAEVLMYEDEKGASRVYPRGQIDRELHGQLNSFAARWLRKIIELRYTEKSRPYLEGVTVNNFLAKPKPPGPWINEDECDCGAQYKDFRAKTSWAEAYASCKKMQQICSKGPVLWIMYVNKLSEWYERHLYCGAEYR